MKHFKLAAIAVALSATSVSAASVTLDFTGSVTSVVDNTGQASNFFEAEDNFSYSVTIDSSAGAPAAGGANSDTTSITAYSFTFGNFSTSGTTGGLVIGESAPVIVGGAQVTGDQVGFSHFSAGINSLLIGAPRNDFASGDNTIGGLSLQTFLVDQTSNVLDFVTPNASITDLANSLANNSAFIANSSPTLFFSDGGNVGATGIIVNATLTDLSVAVAPVPLPAALPLLAVGLLGMGVVARRKKSA